MQFIDFLVDAAEHVEIANIFQHARDARDLKARLAAKKYVVSLRTCQKIMDNKEAIRNTLKHPQGVY